MPKLSRSLQAWKSDDFARILCDEIRQLGTNTLPLDTGQGGVIDNNSLGICVLSSCDDDNTIELKIGAFFTEVVGGCNCADDPVSTNAYGELQVIIDKSNAEADIAITQD